MDELRTLVEEAFREGWRAGYSTGDAGGPRSTIDDDWNISMSCDLEVRTPCPEPTEDEVAKALEETSALLERYRKETPPGHSPHMICHLADAALDRARVALKSMESSNV